MTFCLWHRRDKRNHLCCLNLQMKEAGYDMRCSSHVKCSLSLKGILISEQSRQSETRQNKDSSSCSGRPASSGGETLSSLTCILTVLGLTSCPHIRCGCPPSDLHVQPGVFSVHVNRESQKTFHRDVRDLICEVSCHFLPKTSTFLRLVTQLQLKLALAWWQPVAFTSNTYRY